MVGDLDRSLGWTGVLWDFSTAKTQGPEVVSPGLEFGGCSWMLALAEEGVERELLGELGYFVADLD